MHRWHRRLTPLLHWFVVIALLAPTFLAGGAPAALAAHTPEPSSVALVGSLQSEAAGGACGDWDPACAAANFAPQGNLVYLFNAASIPAGNWEYKVALNGGWAENYGANFQQDGPNIALNLASERGVRFYYDHKTHYIADNVRNTIYSVPGSFNSEIGCGSDWQPECLRTLMSDVDDDGVFTFVTEAIPAGNYEFKIATNESWSNPNYGQGGGGANVPFSVPGAGFRVTFSFNTANNIPDVTVVSLGPKPDNNVEWDGLRHDSRDLLYRTPGGAVPAGAPVTIRFRAFHNDVTAVRLRVYDLNDNAQRFYDMAPAAADVSCYQAGLEDHTCDFWAYTLPNAAPNNLWYRFIVIDGTDTDYYADDTAALDGGLGRTTDEAVDWSYALMVYDPAFTAPDWARNAVIYQIFPDRFRNGRSDNDPRTGDVRYDDPVLALPWGTLPEGYCRNYADGATNCPWRFDDTPPDWSPTKEGPRGRDYMGGDLKGVDQRLEYLKSLGVTAIYFNPIFDAGSNHNYDTQDYTRIDPYFGTPKDWENLVKHANQLGIRIILDGVFNHLSSDSPFFDRYGHYDSVGACESLASPYRSWFYFNDVPAGTGTCMGSAGANSATYDGWFGFDSIPVLNKTNPQVQAYFLTNPDSIARTWLEQGAGGWRMDVSGDASFPNGYWESFRAVTKSTRPDALLISETWQKDSTLLRMLRGDRLDTTMNYRLRDAVLGFLAPGAFDSKGFGDSGRIIAPSEFAARVASIREDYPDAAFYSLMNLLDSHDTERLLWTLTPGAETRADKEFNATNVEEGKRRLRVAALVQFTMPGAPTIYYGDEIGLTGDDDPDDRRTYPWSESSADASLRNHYRWLSSVRREVGALTGGDLRFLLADDAAGTVAYARRTAGQVALVVLNRSSAEQTVSVPLAGYVPDGVTFSALWGANVAHKNYLLRTVADGALTLSLPPMSGLVMLASPLADVTPPSAPAGLRVTNEGDGRVSLEWAFVPGASRYNVYRSPLTGGGFVKVNTDLVNGTAYTDLGLSNGRIYYYVVRALDEAGNESGNSNEVSALPHYVIGWANLQWPPAMQHTLSVTDRTDDAYGQVWINGVTSQPGATPTLRAQLGFGPTGTDPAAGGWTWVDAAFNVDAGNNDEFKASLLPEALGAYDYVYRYTTTDGRDWLYADLNGPIPSGALPPNPGKLTVVSNGDATPPATPTGLRVVAASPGGIELAWDAVVGDPTLYGYEVLRAGVSGGPYTQIARLTATAYTDTAVAEGATYYYVVRALDNAFNRSGNSSEVSGTAALRTVSVVFNITVPASTDGTGRSVYIAGSLNRLDGGLPEWNPGGVVLTRVDATHWTITLTGQESTQIEYKYTLGSWDFVEKGAACDEIANRPLTLTYGATGTQTVNDVVLNWRNVAPCGN